MSYDINKPVNVGQLELMATNLNADYTKKIQDASAEALKSVKVEGNTVQLFKTADQSGEPAASFDFPTEIFLDQAKTTFVPEFAFSAETYPGAVDPSLEGKSVMVLAVKGTDGDEATETVTYSFIDVSKLVDTYEAEAGDGSTTVTVDGYKISVNVNVSEKEGNMLQKDETGKLFVPTPAAVDLSPKADKVTGATAGNIPKLDAEGNIADSGVAADQIITKDMMATDDEVKEMLTKVLGTIIEDAEGASF